MRASSPPRLRIREGFEETGVHGRLVRKLGDVRYVYTWEGERVFKIVSFYLARAADGRIGALPPGMEREVAEARWLPLVRRGAPARVSRRARDGREGAGGARERASDSALYSCPAAVPTFALNFYNPAVAEQLRSLRKTATIRLGDKSSKYRKGMIVTVLCGVRYGQRERVFDAVIDKVDVKRLAELSPREIEHDNPELRRPEELAHFLSQLYNREVTAKTRSSP